MRLEEPKVEFVNIDLESEICTTSGQDGSHCTNEAYSALSCADAAPQLCE